MAMQIKDINKSSKKAFNILDTLTRKRELLPLSLIILYFVLFSILYPKVFPTLYNLSSLLLEWSIPAVLCMGMAIVLISREIDLTVGYNVMFSSMVCGTMIVYQVPIPLAIMITLALSGLTGLIIGTLITKVGINSFIVTLAFGNIFYGLSQFISLKMYMVNIAGVELSKLSDAFVAIGRTQLVKGLNLQLPIIYALVIIIAMVVFSNTVTFKKYYYIGANFDAARLSGIKTNKLKTNAFVLSSMLSCICGIILISRYGTASVNVGVGMELQAITACVIGGISFTGGRGKISGALIGAFFMVCLYNGLRITNVASNIYNILMGSILLLAVIVDAVFSKRKIVG